MIFLIKRYSGGNIISFIIASCILIAIAEYTINSLYSFGTGYNNTNITNKLPSSSYSLFKPAIAQNSASKLSLQNLTANPHLVITNPYCYPSTVFTKRIKINGIALNTENKIQKVEASYHTFPFRDDLKFKPVHPIASMRWSKWQFPVTWKDPGIYRILVRAVDNQIRAETTINAPFFVSQNKSVKFAFVRPTFTEAAYQYNAFYTFFNKYSNSTLDRMSITKDLDMLTAPLTGSLEERESANTRKLFSHWSNLTALIPSDPYHRYLTQLVDVVRRAEPYAILSIIRDEDVHDGYLFTSNRSNAYDLLFLFHNEYVTQAEYTNLKHFVSNGGAIIFIDPNIFYAEVRYDKDKHTITLVKGHDWEFDGRLATKSIGERWYNESKEWIGGNYLVNDVHSSIALTNNPFNYTHSEEQFVNNPNDRIVLDYGLKFNANYINRSNIPSDLVKRHDINVATYELDYGKGKVIMMGLFGQNLVSNKAFQNFLKGIIYVAMRT